jgi:hypothetical protein
MKKLMLLVVIFFSLSALAHAESGGYGSIADTRAVETYPTWTWGEVKTITYDQVPGIPNTAAKVTLDDGSFIWTDNDQARGVFCQARALNLLLVIHWIDSNRFSTVAIVNHDPLEMAGIRNAPPDNNGWTRATVTTITHESSGSHEGSWRIVTSDNSTIWVSNPTVLGIVCQAYALNLPLLTQWRSSTVYDYVSILNEVF